MVRFAYVQKKAFSEIFNSTSACACVLDNCFIRQHKLAKTLKCDRALTSESVDFLRVIQCLCWECSNFESSFVIT